MEKLLYFIFVVLTYVKHRNKLISYSRFYKQKYKRSSGYFLFMAYIYALKYSMHPLYYFYTDAYGDKEFDPNEHANSLFTYNFQKRLNNKAFIKYFSDKRLFNKYFKSYMCHKFLNLKNITLEELREWIDNIEGNSLMLKKANGLGGLGIKKIDIHKDKGVIYFNNKELKDAFISIKKHDILEEFVVQHEQINRLNPSCLNTVRIVTVIDKNNNVNIIGAVLRLGVENDVDNLSAGGIAVNIDINTGCLTGEGFKLAQSEPSTFFKHPITQVVLDAYSLPHWELLINTVKKAAKVFPQVRTIGWDLAITADGVDFIEGNHDWGIFLIEKALKRGIRKELEKYL
ncbi:sugar-transfer associated ATP-grasp domain-containing protein [Ancylomarina sp. 16SWW S1-10-2]|uniref:sugar-transfer associated ATP-grasp domain-containing protein n=1 Tax=Ancylomarina sp. 16SWW S1-10-2 TaxID=2499681 RepID=UPI0018A038A5|nr:sugar-transfer associated ATP-grasp domain-containing protein [Ancylomarina sp. 16SWW S1-10-2]